MVCHPSPIYGKQYKAAYGRQMTVKGDYNYVWQQQRVVYEECGLELAVVSMAAHLQKQHGWSGQSMALPLQFPPHTPK